MLTQQLCATKARSATQNKLAPGPGVLLGRLPQTPPPVHCTARHQRPRMCLQNISWRPANMHANGVVSVKHAAVTCALRRTLHDCPIALLNPGELDLNAEACEQGTPMSAPGHNVGAHLHLWNSRSSPVASRPWVTSLHHVVAGYHAEAQQLIASNTRAHSTASSRPWQQRQWGDDYLIRLGRAHPCVRRGRAWCLTRAAVRGASSRSKIRGLRVVQTIQ